MISSKKKSITKLRKSTSKEMLSMLNAIDSTVKLKLKSWNTKSSKKTERRITKKPLMLLTVLTLLTLTSPNNKEDKFLSSKVKLKSLSNSLFTRITKSISISLNTEPSRAISKKISDNSSSTTMTLERDSTNWNTLRISKLKNSALRSALLTAIIKKDLRNSKLKSTILKTNSRELKVINIFLIMN